MADLVGIIGGNPICGIRLGSHWAVIGCAWGCTAQQQRSTSDAQHSTADAQHSTADAWSMGMGMGMHRDHGAERMHGDGCMGWMHGDGCMGMDAWSMAVIGSMAYASAWEQNSHGHGRKTPKNPKCAKPRAPPTFEQGRFRIGPGRKKFFENPQPLCI